MTAQTKYPIVESIWLDRDGPLTIAALVAVSDNLAEIMTHVVDRDDFAAWIEREIPDALMVEDETPVAGTSDVTVAFWKIDPYDAMDGHVDFTDEDIIKYLNFKTGLKLNKE